MPTPLEVQILNDFEKRLTADETIPEVFAQELMALTRGDGVPSAEALIDGITTNVGDRSV